MEYLEVDEDEVRTRKSFLQFEAEDVARLAALNDVAARYADDVIDEFYRHLLSFDEMREFFTDPEQLERVKAAQKRYFLALTSGDYGYSYIEDRLRIGAVHEKISLPMKSYLSMYNFYLRTVADRLFRHGDAVPSDALDSFLSLMKLTFLDISLAIDTYISARERTIADQERAIRELSTPVLQVRHGILILPLIGMIDASRAVQLTEQMLQSIRSRRAKTVVLDITGVPHIDSMAAGYLVRTVEAARLMGARAIVSGVSPEIALTLVSIGADLDRVETIGDLQGGIERAEQLCGYRMVPAQ